MAEEVTVGIVTPRDHQRVNVPEVVNRVSREGR